MNEKQERKKYAKRGTREQKILSFRVDLENVEWLDLQPNKGRYLNELIMRDKLNH